MRFADIPADILVLRVKQTGYSSVTLKEQPVLSVKTSLTHFEIHLNDSVVSVKPISPADFRLLSNKLATGQAMLAQLANPAMDDSIELQIAFFNGECLEMGDVVEIGVNKYVEDKIASIAPQRNKPTRENIYNYLEQKFCFRRGSESFFFMLAGPAIDSELKKPDTVEESSSAKTEASRKNSFCIIGDDIRFVATETQLPDKKSIYIPTRLTQKINKHDNALRLARGKLKFIDWSEAGAIQILTKVQLNKLINTEGSYLKKWDEFGDIEGELVLKRARSVGVLRYNNMKLERNGYISVRISQAEESVFKLLETGGLEEVENVSELPAYLENQDLSFAQFVYDIEQDTERETIAKKSNIKPEEKVYLNIKEYDSNSKTLTVCNKKNKKDEDETKLPPSGMLILSLAGEITQIKRRMAARKMILEGRSANPQLGLLIEEKGEIAQTCNPPKSKPLTAFVKNKIFEKPPTFKQEKAIEVALATPDIALIQGPPGTGKTTVIAAILERLNEMSDKRGINIKGQVLLTGFQHDAVENMISRLWPNGIPVPKFGRRSGANEDELDPFEEKLEKWCAQIANDLRPKIPKIDEIDKETKIRNLSLQYINAPTRSLGANLAKNIASLDITVIGEETKRRASNIAKELSREETLNTESNLWLDAVRRLRTRPESFADDGPDQAANALTDLEDALDDKDLHGARELLEKASLWSNEKTPPFMDDLAKLKKKLLIHFTAPPVFRTEKQSDVILSLAEKAIEKIKKAGFSVKDKKSAALAEFLIEIESNPYGIIDAVSDYSYAFAATCQQSVNTQMQRQKGIVPGGDTEKKMEYEYVIVDEAARVSPRDLMIPMSQGKRIILVGDHRQLPHIIDDEVARQMEAGEKGEEESDWLKKSMFEYLFSERLKDLEQKDNITRRVTLDTQYRMHPLLGDFISRNFYERFDSSEKFLSVRPESDFSHNLPNTDNKPALWLDVPTGREEWQGTSRIRRTEATAITNQLKAWMNSKEAKGLSFGIISFYKAQADLIESEINKIKTALIESEIDKSKYEKLIFKIGTVDSFQGMEFDVVFLSMVRTAQENRKPKIEDRKMQARNLFGHLCLYNRLNVSMSRQKKLLVVVGDSGLLKDNDNLAQEFIPGLVDFYKLCMEKGKVLNAS